MVLILEIVSKSNELSTSLSMPLSTLSSTYFIVKLINYYMLYILLHTITYYINYSSLVYYIELQYRCQNLFLTCPTSSASFYVYLYLSILPSYFFYYFVFSHSFTSFCIIWFYISIDTDICYSYESFWNRTQSFSFGKSIAIHFDCQNNTLRRTNIFQSQSSSLG